MILIVNICAERLHYFEFVKPIEDIIERDFVTKHYLDLSLEDLKKCDKVIICGTSLRDNDFLGRYHEFDWLLNFNKPVLGVCGGMQIIGMVFGNVGFKGRFFRKTEIGFYKEKFERRFLGLEGEVEVYHLHNNYVKFNSKDFLIFNKGRVSQAVCYKKKKIYGVLFHPEVRNREVIMRFVGMGY